MSRGIYTHKAGFLATTHTPAPWVWKRLEYDQPHVPEFTLDGPDVLCRYWRDEQPSADAVLISAVPDLLKAAQAALAEMVRATRATAQRDSFTDAVDLLDAAITNATGAAL
jgi:hypothetical protein